MPKNFEARERKQRKRKNADMVVSNRSIKTIASALAQRAQQLVRGPACAQCGMRRESPMHSTIAQCRAAMVHEGRDCARPAEHHRYRPVF